jgi:hypothetical protein
LGSGTERGGFGGLAVFEVIEDRVLAVLVFGGKLRSSRCAFLRAFVENAAAGFGDAVDELAAHFGGERHHAAKDFAKRRDVILRDPFGETHQFGREQGSVVEELLDGLDFEVVGGRVVVGADDDAHQALSAEGDEHARADLRDGPVHRVGEGAVERNGQGDVAVERHVDLGHIQSNAARC